MLWNIWMPQIMQIILSLHLLELIPCGEHHNRFPLIPVFCLSNQIKSKRPKNNLLLCAYCNVTFPGASYHLTSKRSSSSVLRPPPQPPSSVVGSKWHLAVLSLRGGSRRCRRFWQTRTGTPRGPDGALLDREEKQVHTINKMQSETFTQG